MKRILRRAAILLGLAVACTRSPASPPSAAPISQRPDTLERLHALITEGPFPLPSPFACAGFDEAREFEIDGRRRVVVLSCNRDGLVALFRADGTLVATHATEGKPIVVTAFTYDESGKALDKLLVEEFSWGTGIVAREAVVYRFTDQAIAQLWREEIWVRAGGPGLPEQTVDGFVRLSRGVYEGHGPILTYGLRNRAAGQYKERQLEVGGDAVRPYSGAVE